MKTNTLYTLSKLAPGQYAYVRRLENPAPMKRRLMDLGLTEHTKVLCLGRSPFKDPSAYLIRGAVIAIRQADSQKIIVEIQ